MLGRVKSFIRGDQQKQKLLALVLCGLMVSSMLPVNALAATQDGTHVEGDEVAAEETADAEVSSEEAPPPEEDDGDGGINPLDATQVLNGDGTLDVFEKGSTAEEAEYLLSVSNAPTNTKINLDSTHIQLTEQETGSSVEVDLEGNLYYAADGTDEEDWVLVAYLMLDDDLNNAANGSYVLTPYDEDGNQLDVENGKLFLVFPKETLTGKVWKIQTNTLCTLDERTGSYTQEIIEAVRSFDPVTFVLDDYNDGDRVNLSDILIGYDEFYYGSVDGTLDLTSCTQGIVWEGELYPLNASGVRVSDAEIYAVYDHLYSFDVEVNNIVNEHTEDNGDTYLWKGDTFYIDQFHNQGVDDPKVFTKNASNWFGYGGIWPQLGYLREEQINNNGVPFSTYRNYSYSDAISEQVTFTADGQTRSVNTSNNDSTLDIASLIGDTEYADYPYGISGSYQFTDGETDVTAETYRVTGRVGDEFLATQAFDTDTVYIITEETDYYDADTWLNVGSHASDDGQRAWFYWISDFYRVNNYEDEVEYVKIDDSTGEIRLVTDEIGPEGDGVEYDLRDITGLYAKRPSEIKSYMLDNQETLEEDQIGFYENAGWPNHMQLRLNTTVQTMINGVAYNGKLDVMTGDTATQPILSYDITYTDDQGNEQHQEGSQSVTMDREGQEDSAKQESQQVSFSFPVDIQYAFDADKVVLTVSFNCTGTLTGSDGNTIVYTSDNPLYVSFTLTSDQLKEAYDCCPNSDGYDVAINLSDIIRLDNEQILTLYKIWDDDLNAVGARDDVTSVTVALQRSEDGMTWEDVLVNQSDPTSGRKAFVISGSPEESSWSLELSSEDLDLTYVDDNGDTQEYQFRIVEEQEIEGVLEGYTYYPTFEADELVLAVTNSLSENPITVSVEKQWLDGDGNALAEEDIPDSVIVALFRDGKFYDKQTISKDNEWSWTFTNLPQRANNPYEYTVAELDSEGRVIEEGQFITLDDHTYQVTVSNGTDTDYVIDNVYETVDVEGTKTWDDDENRDGTRPASITIYLLAGSEVISETIVVPDGNGTWSWSFKDLPKYNSDGEEISYHVIEQANEGYSAEYPEGTYDIVNTHTPDQTSVSVVKDWDDSGDQDGARPEEITVYLYADGVLVLDEEGNPVSLVLNEGNDWRGSFTELDLYEDEGQKITYTIEEASTIPDYESRIIEIGEDSYAFAIVNTHTPETTDITVHKYWDDQDNQNNTRPSEVVVTLTGTYENEDGESVVCSTQIMTITGTDDWTAVFTDLPVNYEGYEITYTISELTVDGYDVTIDGYEITNTLDVPGKSVETDGDDDFEDDGELILVGDTLTYQIDYHNYEDTEATITITDVLDQGLDFVSATDGGTYEESTRTITWVLDEVPADEEGFVQFTVTVNADALTEDEVRNTASVAVGEHSALDTNTVENPLPEPPEKAVETDGDNNFDDNGFTVQVGDEVTYQVRYKNYQEEAATVTITDELDVGLDFVSATDGGVYDEDTRTITWTLPDVEAGYEGAVQFVTIVNESALNKFEVDNTAYVQVGNDSAMETNTVENPIPENPYEPQNPVKDVDTDGDGVFEDDGETVQIGDSLTYRIRYYNHYADPVTVTITDVLDEALDFVSATDGGVYDEGTRTITWTIENAPGHTWGSVAFTARVNDKAVTDEPIVNTATVQIGNDAAVRTNRVRNPIPGVGGVKAPKTGDANHLGIWMTMMAMSTMMIGLVCSTKRRKNKTKTTH